MIPLILASASPRRMEILQALGWPFKTIPSLVSEEETPHRDPVEASQHLALKKAREVASRIQEGLVLGADTLVHLAGYVLGKPRDATMAREYLRLLSGKTHGVTTGLALVDACSGREEVTAETTWVRMHRLSSSQIESYLETDEPYDKAGAYAIQGKGFILIDRIWGCYTNVVGLPVGRLRELLARFDPAWPEGACGGGEKWSR